MMYTQRKNPADQRKVESEPKLLHYLITYCGNTTFFLYILRIYRTLFSVIIRIIVCDMKLSVFCFICKALFITAMSFLCNGFLRYIFLFLLFPEIIKGLNNLKPSFKNVVSNLFRKVAITRFQVTFNS